MEKHHIKVFYSGVLSQSLLVPKLFNVFINDLNKQKSLLIKVGDDKN